MEQKNSKKLNWYEVKGYSGHCGAGKAIDKIFYIKAANTFSALKKCKRVPYIKKYRRGRIKK